MKGATDGIDRLAVDTEFSGVVRVDADDEVVFVKAYGQANRAYELPNTVETQFAIASGTKGFTALTVAALIEPCPPRPHDDCKVAARTRPPADRW